MRVPIKKRMCLKCQKPFDSTGPGNRFCSKCNRANVREVHYEGVRLEAQGGKKSPGSD